MGRKNKRTYHDTFTVLLTRVPIDWPLSYITGALQRRFTSSISIYRICEYPEGRESEEVFVTVYDEADYLTFKEFKSLIIRRREIPIQFKDWVLGSAKFPSRIVTANPEEINEMPINLRIPDTKELKRNTGEYLHEIVMSLEEIGGRNLIGASLIYNYNSSMLRPFAFASYKNRDAMLMQLNKCIDINGDIIMCEEASSVPFVVIKNSCKSIKCRPTKNEWNEELKRVNWLTILSEVISDSEESLVLDSEHEFDDCLDLAKKQRIN